MKLRLSPYLFAAAVVAVLSACTSMPRGGTGPTSEGPGASGAATRDAQMSSSAPSDTRAAPSTSTARAAAAQPDPQMQQVLNELRALGAKPLHSLSVDAARHGPSPADAVKEVLKKQ